MLMQDGVKDNKRRRRDGGGGDGGGWGVKDNQRPPKILQSWSGRTVEDGQRDADREICGNKTAAAQQQHHFPQPSIAVKALQRE